MTTSIPSHADLVHHLPDRLLRDVEYAVNLHALHSFEIGHHDVDRVDPMSQENMDIFEDRNHSHIEALFAGAISILHWSTSLGARSVNCATVSAISSVSPSCLLVPQFSCFVNGDSV